MLDCSKIDELMMDWLYQELDESSSTWVAEHVAGCARCSAEASALRRTRQAFRELSPVDPPVAVSAILLHEAARRAPSVPVAAAGPVDAESGFWERVRSWFRPIMLHPAAAAVAMLVLIAGVAGTLYVRHGDEMTDTRDVAPAETATAAAKTDLPTPSTPAAVDSEAVPEPPVAAVTAPTDSDDATVDRDGYTADVLGKEAQAELSREVAEQRLESSAKDAAKRFSSEKKPPAPSKKARKPVEPKGPIANAVSGADPLIEGETGNLDLQGGLRGGSAQGRAADKMQKSAQPPPPPASTAKPSAGASTRQAIDFADPGAGDGAYRVYKDKPMSETELRSNEGKLGAAVKKRDCTTAARIANDILDRNPTYYYKKVAASAKPCQGFVANETRARSARRASKNVGSGKNVSAPQKTKQAPQKDEAAAEAAE